MPTADAGPGTGGQYAAHEALHLDSAGVSGANQYRVKPPELVSTRTPPTVAVRRLPAAGAARGAPHVANATPNNTRAAPARPRAALSRDRPSGRHRAAKPSDQPSAPA